MNWKNLEKIKTQAPFLITLVESPKEFKQLLGETIFFSPSLGFSEALNIFNWPLHEAKIINSLNNWPNPEHVELISPEANWRYFLSRLNQSPQTLILGGGHIGRALSQILIFLGHLVTVVDDRPEFISEGYLPPSAAGKHLSYNNLAAQINLANFQNIVIVTRGHASDLSLIRQLIKLEPLPNYLGLIGSRKRSQETLKLLASEGIDENRLAQIHSPIGLKINAQTPEEIAISIASEIIAFQRKSSVSV